MNKTYQICRFCTKTEYLEDLYKIDDGISLVKKAFYCIGVEIQIEDGIPALICKACKKKINKFYRFKQKCLEIEFKLKNNKIYSTQKILDCDEGNLFNETYDDTETAKPYELTSPQAKLCIEQKIKMCSSNKSYILSNHDLQKHHKESRFAKTNKLNSKFQCELCGHIFKLKTVLEKHLMIHSGVKPFPCKICPKRFSRDENKIIHMRSHMGIKPFICEVCGKASTKYQDLVRHKKVHSDERNYSCSKCNRQFKRSSDLISHMRTHTGIRPYICLMCKKSYTSHGGLRKHSKTHCKS